MNRSLLAAFALVLAQTALARAHPLAPSLLEVRELAAGKLEVRWKTPVAGIPGAELRPLLPDDCTIAGAPVVSAEEAAIEARWTAECASPSLVGRTIGASGIAESRADVLVRVGLADGRRLRAVLSPQRPLFTVPARQGWLEVARSYFRLGVEHILTGADHLLFVLGLLLLIAGVRSLLWTLTAFTLGHSVTLSLAVLGFVHVPQAHAEAAIALSIFVLAVELARGEDRPESWMRRRPWAMAALFGLLHGLGFAGALTEIGLPADDIPLALISFNLGIEAGQVVFVAVMLAARAAIALLPLRRPLPIAPAAAYVIGSLAAMWIFERMEIVLKRGL